MAETSNKKGAQEFKRNLVALLNQQDRIALMATHGSVEITVTKNVSSPIRIIREENLVTVSKSPGPESFSPETTDFTFKFRILSTSGDVELWPVYFNDKAGRTLQAEMTFGGKVMTNAHLQNELIDLANTWGKSLSSQALTRSIEGLI